MKFKKIKKKPLFFLLLLLALGIVGTTFAYYYTEIAIPNQFRAMTYNVTPVVLRINYNELWRKEVKELNYH